MGLEGVHLVTLLYITLMKTSNCFHFWSRGLEIVELFSLLGMREKRWVEALFELPGLHFSGFEGVRCRLARPARGINYWASAVPRLPGWLPGSRGHLPVVSLDSYLLSPVET